MEEVPGRGDDIGGQQAAILQGLQDGARGNRRAGSNGVSGAAQALKPVDNRSHEKHSPGHEKPTATTVPGAEAVEGEMNPLIYGAAGGAPQGQVVPGDDVRLAAALGAAAKVARRTGRTLTAVYQRRASLGRAAASGWREPEDVTLLEVIEAVDGPTRGDVPDVGQDWAAPARRLQQACDEAAALARQRLAKVTRAELARGKRKRLRPENVKDLLRQPANRCSGRLRRLRVRE
jgi:hypothetical protein